MGYTNKTSHYDLPQWIAGDKPSWLGDMNTAMLNIDTAIAASDASASAAESSAAAANAQVQAQEAKITKNATDIQALTESLAETQGEVNNVKTIAEGALPKSGGTMTGRLILNGAPTSDLQAATKKYVDDNSGKGALMLSGGTMTGPLTLSGAPTADLMAATKKYVDDKATAFTLAHIDGVCVGGGYSYSKLLVFSAILSTIGTVQSGATLFTAPGNPLSLTPNQAVSLGIIGVGFSGFTGDNVTTANTEGSVVYDGTNTLVKLGNTSITNKGFWLLNCCKAIG